MNIPFKNPLEHISAFWSKLTVIRKIILAGIILVVIGGFAALLTIPLTPAPVSVIDSPIRNEAALGRIVLRINQEDVKVNVTVDGIVRVVDEATARRMRVMLIREGLIPSELDPWAIFDR
jgi:flagellar M-ring protein FliF